jgi:chemotaxis protein CheD
MLPDSNDGSSLNRPCLHAGIATAFLLEQLDENGAARENIVAKMVGGASMFANGDDSGPTIGEQNIISIRHILNQEQIPLIGKDVGGNYGRSIQLYLDSGKVIVSSIGKGSREI